MILKKVSLPNDKLKQASLQERAFLMRSMNLITELEIVQKCLVFSSNPILKGVSAIGSIANTAQVAQSLYFARILAGILNEAYELLQKGFFSSEKVGTYQMKNLRDKYLFDMRPEEKAGLENLVQYFSRDDDLRTVRKMFAFHFDIQKLLQETDVLLPQCAPEIFVAEAPANCLFTMADQLLVLTMAKKMGYETSDLKFAIDKFMKDISGLAKDCTAFFFGYIRVFLARYVHENGYELEEVEINVPPQLSDIDLPYFSIRN